MCNAGVEDLRKQKAAARPDAVQAADATCALAGIWLAMGPSHGHQAAQQLRSVLPTVLGNADTDLQARVQLLLAQALLADASSADLKADPEE